MEVTTQTYFAVLEVQKDEDRARMPSADVAETLEIDVAVVRKVRRWMNEPINQHRIKCLYMIQGDLQHDPTFEKAALAIMQDNVDPINDPTSQRLLEMIDSCRDDGEARFSEVFHQSRLNVHGAGETRSERVFRHAPFVFFVLLSSFLLHQRWNNMPPFAHVTQGIDWTQVNDVWNQTGWPNFNLCTDDSTSKSLLHPYCQFKNWKGQQRGTGFLLTFAAKAFRSWNIVVTGAKRLFSSLINLYWILSTIDSWTNGYVTDIVLVPLLGFPFLVGLYSFLSFLIRKFFQIGWLWWCIKISVLLVVIIGIIVG